MFSAKPRNPEDQMQGQIDALKGSNAAVAAAGANGGGAGAGANAPGTVANGVERPESLVMQPYAGGGQPTQGAQTAKQEAVGNGEGAMRLDSPVMQPYAGDNPIAAGWPRTQAAPADMKTDSTLGGDVTPAPSVYDWNQEFTQWLDAPLTAEERAKRERAAHAVAGVGALGNVLSAFSNLAFAGDAAPSQTIPQAPDAGGMVQRERDYWDKVRDRYLTWKMQDRQMDAREKQIAQQAAQYNARLQYQAEKDKLDREFKQAVEDARQKMKGDALAAQIKKMENDYEIKKAQLDNDAKKIGIMASNAATNRGRLALQRDIHNARVNSGGYSRGGSGRGSGTSAVGNVVTSPKGSYQIEKKFDNATEVGNQYNALPLAYREQWEKDYPGYMLLKGKDRQAAQLEAIMAKVAQDDDYAKRLRRNGYLSDYTEVDNSDDSWDEYAVDDDDDFSDYIVK